MKYHCRGYCKAHYVLAPEIKIERAKIQASPKYREKRGVYAKTPMGRLSHLKTDAAKRHIKLTLTLEQYIPKLKLPCFWCDGINPVTTGSGLDRIDNNKSIGYTDTNTVSCCNSCNSTRGDKYSFEEFLLFRPLLKIIREQREAIHG